MIGEISVPSNHLFYYRESFTVNRIQISHKLVASIAFSVLLLFFTTSIFAQNVVRTWTDKTGSFQIEAELLKFQDGNVYLLKKDGKLITVPVDILSNIDKGFLEGMSSKPANPFAGGTDAPMGVPMGNSAAGGNLSLLKKDKTNVLKTNGRSVSVKFDKQLPPIEPDVFTPTKIRSFNVPLGKVDFFAKVTSPILINPSESMYAISVYHHGFGRADIDGKLYLVKGNGGSPQELMDLDVPLMMLDHDVASDRSLVLIDFDDPWNKGGDLVLLDKTSTGKPIAIKRWELPGDKDKGAVKSARMLDGSTALVQVEKKIYHWNLESGSCEWLIDDAGHGSFRLSGNKKYMAIPISGGCQIIDLAKREVLGKVPFSGSFPPQVDFSDSGDRLALVYGNQFLVWDLVKSQVLTEATLADSLGDLIGWVDDKYLLTTRGGLLEPNLGMSVWKYTVPKGSILMAGGIVATHEKSKSYSLAGLQIPHDAAVQMEDKLTSGDAGLLAVAPGSRISIRIETVGGIDKNVIYQGLVKNIEKIGWQVDQASPLQIVATIGRGKRQEKTYRGFGFRGGEETVSMTPFTASFKIMSRNDELWNRASTNGMPFMLHMKEGQSIQEAVRQYEKPNLKFFETLVIPPKILKPEIKKAIGTSSIVNGNWSD
ncbi:MAG: hypothetical protein COA78_23640 [Blastopirellula sp.]|nr:MAG: hypothetical protein COA78_23640 [Blastopirellula sp.]